MHAKNIATCLFPTFFSDIFAGQFSAETFTTDSGIYIDILVILIGKLKSKVYISIRAEYYEESRLHPRLYSPLYSALILNSTAVEIYSNGNKMFQKNMTKFSPTMPI